MRVILEKGENSGRIVSQFLTWDVSVENILLSFCDGKKVHVALDVNIVFLQCAYWRKWTTDRW